MKSELELAIAAAVRSLFGVDVAVELTRPDEQFGDFATNVALQLSKQLGKNPREIADTLVEKLRADLSEQVSEITVAGPGFLNLKLSDTALVNSLAAKPTQTYAGEQVLVEFGDPNPFKEMHIGHLYSYIVGEAVCALLRAAGAQVVRLSYHGDVGLHVAKAIWGMQKEGYNPDTNTDPIKNNIGWYYAKGAAAYQDDETAKTEIDDINAKVYAQDPSILELYNQGKDRSFANFDLTLADLGIKPNDHKYMESESAPVGLEIVKQNIGTVFQESDGAVVYDGEKVGLHTRVFITGKGLPTYEAKDLGLTELKNRDYPQAARSIIITANEQAEYFKVMLAALREINPTLAGKTTHRTHGFVSLSTGKMSSRTGDVYSAISLLIDVEGLARKAFPDTSHDTLQGAIKYAFTKHRMGGDILYDVVESVSLEGNSGPYLQYAHARARSILAKAEAADAELVGLESGERSLLRKITEYTEVVDKAVAELMPHHICTYLYELAQTFNSFYEHNRVIDNERQAVRLQLVQHYADTLKGGLNLLGITAPDRM
jgi:arginyl-tRNA synthetase